MANAPARLAYRLIHTPALVICVVEGPGWAAFPSIAGLLPPSLALLLESLPTAPNAALAAAVVILLMLVVTTGAWPIRRVALLTVATIGFALHPLGVIDWPWVDPNVPIPGSWPAAAALPVATFLFVSQDESVSTSLAQLAAGNAEASQLRRARWQLRARIFGMTLGATAVATVISIAARNARPPVGLPAILVEWTPFVLAAAGVLLLTGFWLLASGRSSDR